MQWLGAPPVVSLEVVETGDGRLVLAGPSSTTRFEGGVNAAGGAALALFGARFLRAPAPFIFPVLFLAAGAVSAVVGAVKLTGHCTVVVDGDGVDFRWRLPIGAERSLHIQLIDIACLVVSARTWTVDNDHGGSQTRQDFVLGLRTLDERLIPFESFTTEGAARDRRAQLEGVLLR